MFQHDATNIHARSTITGARRFSRITGIVPSSARRSPLDPDPHFLGLHPVTVCFQSKKNAQPWLSRLQHPGKTPPFLRARTEAEPAARSRNLSGRGPNLQKQFRFLIQRAVLDATFSSRAHRELLRDESSKANARWEIVELDVDLPEIERRLKARDKSTDEISDARLEDFKKLNAAYEPSTELMDNLMKVSANDSVSETVKTILFQLAERQLR